MALISKDPPVFEKKAKPLDQNCCPSAPGQSWDRAFTFASELQLCKDRSLNLCSSIAQDSRHCGVIPQSCLPLPLPSLSYPRWTHLSLLGPHCSCHGARPGRDKGKGQRNDLLLEGRLGHFEIPRLSGYHVPHPLLNNNDNSSSNYLREFSVGEAYAKCFTALFHYIFTTNTGGDVIMLQVKKLSLRELKSLVQGASPSW